MSLTSLIAVSPIPKQSSGNPWSQTSGAHANGTASEFLSQSAVFGMGTALPESELRAPPITMGIPY
jgi:hypothetical protein